MMKPASWVLVLASLASLAARGAGTLVAQPSNAVNAPSQLDVRGYVNVLGLDEMDWITRFQRAYVDSGQLLEDDRDWIEFAANVGRARVRPRDAATERLKWAGALLLLLIVGIAVFFAVRYYGYRSGWWPTVVPGREPVTSSVRGLGFWLIRGF